VRVCVCACMRARARACVCVCARLLKSSILRSVGDDFREIERSLREIQCFQNAGARAIVDDRAGLWIARGPLFACPPPPNPPPRVLFQGRFGGDSRRVILDDGRRRAAELSKGFLGFN